MTEEKIMGFIRTKVVNNNITQMFLADKMNMSKTTVNRFLRGLDHTKLDYVVSCLDVLGYELVIRRKSDEN